MLLLQLPDIRRHLETGSGRNMYGCNVHGWLGREDPACSTIGSCSGGFLSLEPCCNHSSKAVSCSEKKGLDWNSTLTSEFTILRDFEGGGSEGERERGGQICVLVPRVCYSYDGSLR